MDRLDCIKTFISVIENGNFSRAARSMRITRDQVAKRICYLESDLNVPLLTRNTRGMSLTKYGEKFHSHSKIILSEFEWAKDEINSEQIYPEGEIKINAPLSFSCTFLSNIISSFMDKYPSIKVDLFLTDSFLENNDNHFDITLRVDGNPNTASGDMIIASYFRNFYASPNYLKRQGIPNDLQALKQHDLLLYYQNSTHNKITLSDGDSTVDFHCYPKFTCNNGDLLLELSIQDKGIVFLPDFIAKKHLQSGLIARCLDHYHSPEIYFYVVHTNSLKRVNRVKLFTDFLIQHFQTKPLNEAIFR